MYFPFSRPLEVESLKQMLLVFDSVAFLDPVEDDQWRKKLLLEMGSVQGGGFRQYEEVDAALPLLIDEGAIEKYCPTILGSNETSLASAASLADLLNPLWVDFANRPDKFGLPHAIAADQKTSTWQIFKPKLPEEFLESIMSSTELSEKHVFENGGSSYAWTVSYAAGSSIASNLHLAAAEKLGLAPVTDSRLHHQLLLHKSASRAQKQNVFQDDSFSRDTAGIVTSMVLRSLLPKAKLHDVSFEQILRFREETQSLRREAVTEIGKLAETIRFNENAVEFQRQCEKLERDITSDLLQYRTEMQSVRDRFWPELIEIPRKNLATGSFAAVALSCVGGPGAILLGSIAAAALSLLKVKLNTAAERKKIERSKAPTVSFLTRLQEL